MTTMTAMTSMSAINEPSLRVGICSTYAPRACGLATFAADLETALSGAKGIGAVSIIRMESCEENSANAEQNHHSTPSSVLVGINEHEGDSYLNAALVTNTHCDVVIVQHEFGIFGGSDGKFVINFLRELRVPVILTLHTMLPTFTDGQLSALRAACSHAEVVTVFTDAARVMLMSHGIVEPCKIMVVPHGAPDLLYEADRLKSREALGLREKFVLSTFGLVSPGKGLELAIAALPRIVERIPETVFVVAGRTHPGVHRYAGEDYRASLIEQARELGLDVHIRFINEFLPIEGIAELLAATDVFLTPYVNLDQIVSGVLTFALAAGCPVVSTDYQYAREHLSGGAGTVVLSRDPEEFANAVLQYERRSETASNARAAAQSIGASIHWSTVGASMAEVCRSVVPRTRKRLVARSGNPYVHLPMLMNRPTPILTGHVSTGHGSVLLAAPQPERTKANIEHSEKPLALATEALNGSLLHPVFSRLRTQHLERLVDDTGIVQHATGAVPLLSSGYCVDDVARLIPVARRLAETQNSWESVVAKSVAFLGQAMADVPDGDGARMHNFLGWNREWLDDANFGDHVGRAALGLSGIANDSRYRDMAMPLLKRLLREWPKESSLHPNAYGILAQTTAPESTTPRILAAMVAELWVAFDSAATPQWQWFEDSLRYDYGVFPHALIAAGVATKNVSVTDLGLRTLRWLDEICDDGDFYRFPGCFGLAFGDKIHESGDEQPLEPLALARAHECAYKLTNDLWHRTRALRCHDWFLGRNHLGLSMIDSDGGCFDGLEAESVNRNQGAESTLAYCASLHLVASLGKHREHREYREHHRFRSLPLHPEVLHRGIALMSPEVNTQLRRG